ALVVFGGSVRFLTHEGTAPVRDRSTFQEGPDYLRKPLGIVRHAWQGDDRAIIQLGLLLLIATPVARVLFSVFAFALERDWTYVLVTLLALVVHLYGLFGGHIGGAGGADGWVRVVGRAESSGPTTPLVGLEDSAHPTPGPPAPPPRWRSPPGQPRNRG